MLKGCITALVTPFTDDGLDEKAFQDHVDWQIQFGVHGLVPCGTTGESATLTHEEHMRVIRLCAEVANGRVPVVAGAGSNETRVSIEYAQVAKECGADAALVVTPYYNKPSQEGIFQHFKAHRALARHHERVIKRVYIGQAFSIRHVIGRLCGSFKVGTGQHDPRAQLFGAFHLVKWCAFRHHDRGGDAEPASVIADALRVVSGGGRRELILPRLVPHGVKRTTDLVAAHRAEVFAFQPYIGVEPI